MNLRIIREGIRIGWRGIRIKFTGPTRFDGNAQQICEQVVEACWHRGKGFYAMSLGNYPVFYTRDFGMCIDSLLSLGKRKRVKQTLEWALARYKEYGQIKLIINRKGKPFNFPDVECPDGYAYLLHSLYTLNDKKLIKKYKTFLEKDFRIIGITRKRLESPAISHHKRDMQFLTDTDKI